MTGQFTFDDPFAKLNQRITDLENFVRQVAGGPKVGLAAMHFEQQGDFIDVPIEALDQWFNYFDAPDITLETGSRVILGWGTQMHAFGDDSDYRVQFTALGVGIDGEIPSPTNPDEDLTIETKPIVDGATGVIFEGFPMARFALCDWIEPGEHTFALWSYCQDDNPAGTVFPQLNDTWLMVIPLGWQ